MGHYDNYCNKKRIKLAQKKLDRLLRKRKPNKFAIDLAREELEKQKLFESCQIFKSFSGFAPNERILFNDDNRAILFGDVLIWYKDIKSYQIIENIVETSYTTTQSKGAVSRAIVGGALAGGIGAVIGAATADTESNTTYYNEKDGFLIQIFLKNGKGHQLKIDNCGMISNRLHPKWLELGAKLQMIIDGKQ